MISDDDVTKIRKALKPDFDQMFKKSDLPDTEQRIEQGVRKALKPDFDRLATKLDLKLTEKNIKKYIHEGVDAVVEGVDNLLSEYKYDERINKLEKIHPQGRHRSID